MRHVFIDLETFSDVNLPATGVHPYVASPAHRILLLGYAVGNGPVTVLDLAGGDRIPSSLAQLLRDSTVLKHAHNAAFERANLEAYGMTCTPEHWVCTQAWAYSLGLPGGLAALASSLELEINKMDAGARLIQRFCTPEGRRHVPRPTEDPDWPVFVEYCRQDVEVQRRVSRRLWPYMWQGLLNVE